MIEPSAVLFAMYLDQVTCCGVNTVRTRRGLRSWFRRIAKALAVCLGFEAPLRWTEDGGDPPHVLREAIDDRCTTPREH